MPAVSPNCDCCRVLCDRYGLHFLCLEAAPNVCRCHSLSVYASLTLACHTCARKHTHAHTHTHTHTRTHTHMHTHTQKHTHTCMHACSQTHTRTHTHTHAHTHMHTHTHTHTHRNLNSGTCLFPFIIVLQIGRR